MLFLLSKVGADMPDLGGDDVNDEEKRKRQNEQGLSQSIMKRKLELPNQGSDFLIFCLKKFTYY